MNFSCKVCSSARQRNLVNFRYLTDEQDNYVCLECLLFPHTASVNMGRYHTSSPDFATRKSTITRARQLLPTVSATRDVHGYYIVDVVALGELRILLRGAGT